MSLMLGELNASHMGISAPPQGTQTTLGRLAVDFDRADTSRTAACASRRAAARTRGARAASSAATTSAGRRHGRSDRAANLDELSITRSAGAIALRWPRRQRRVARHHRQADRSADREGFALSPVGRAEARLRREGERRQARIRAHVRHVGECAVQLHLDLDADNHGREGVVVDVRNNNGGFVNLYAIDVFARRGYFNMQRGALPRSRRARCSASGRSSCRRSS